MSFELGFLSPNYRLRNHNSEVEVKWFFQDPTVHKWKNQDPNNPHGSEFHILFLFPLLAIYSLGGSKEVQSKIKGEKSSSNFLLNHHKGHSSVSGLQKEPTGSWLMQSSRSGPSLAPKQKAHYFKFTWELYIQTVGYYPALKRMSYQAMKKCRGVLNACYKMKEANLKRLHTLWFLPCSRKRQS